MPFGVDNLLPLVAFQVVGFRNVDLLGMSDWNDECALGGKISPVEGEILQPASVYHLYRFKRKFINVCSLHVELNRAVNDIEKCLSINDLQCRILSLKRLITIKRKQAALERRESEKRQQCFLDSSKLNQLTVRRKQLRFQKANLESHLNNEKLNLRIKNAYLKSMRQQYLHALLTDVFPITCSDAYSPTMNRLTKSIHTGGAIESMLLSSVLPSALNKDQFMQLDEAINTHYLGQGFWSNDDVTDICLDSDGHYSYGIASISICQPEKYDQCVNLIGRMFATHQKLAQANSRQRFSSISENMGDITLSGPLSAQLPDSGNLACHLNLEPEVIEQAYNQSAALCHLAQLIHISSYILSVPLPNRQCYYFFMGFDYSPRALHEALCKLDLNIIFLCLSQGVSSNKLRPDHNIRNLIHCFSLTNPCLGESNISFSLDFDLCARVEDFFTRYDTLNRLRFDRNGDLGEDEPTDWEELPEKVSMTREELKQIQETYTRGLAGSGSAVGGQTSQILNSSAAAIFTTVTSWLSAKSFSITD